MLARVQWNQDESPTSVSPCKNSYATFITSTPLVFYRLADPRDHNTVRLFELELKYSDESAAVRVNFSAQSLSFGLRVN